MIRRILTSILIGALFFGFSVIGSAASPGAKADLPAMDAARKAKAEKLIAGGVKYLLSQRDDGGGWSINGANRPAVTAMVLKVLLQQPGYTVDSPVVKKGLGVLLSYRQKDGGIYNPKEGQSSYTTSLALMTLSAAARPQDKPVIDAAVKYLKDLQVVPGSESPDGKTVSDDSPNIGGFDYGKSGEPNLSVTGMVVEGLHDAGVDPNDPSMKRALVFLSRVQNRSESNPLAFAHEGAEDGGFVYTPGTSKAGKGPGGRGLRSYGSMTYVGFKSMLYAGLNRNDPRVRAAYQWICRYWRLNSNPNMPRVQSQQGLYYYYLAFAKALRAWGQPVITDSKGVKHNWREELIDAMANRVGKDGSWTNKEDRWYESNSVLVTAYAVQALQQTLEK